MTNFRYDYDFMYDWTHLENKIEYTEETIYKPQLYTKATQPTLADNPPQINKIFNIRQSVRMNTQNSFIQKKF